MSEPETRVEELDPAIRDLVATLNNNGIRTFQSCSGHGDSETHPSACVWVEQGALSNETAERLSWQTGIEQVGLLFGREVVPVWEIQFAGETLPGFREAQDAIIALLQPPVASERYLACTLCGHLKLEPWKGTCEHQVFSKNGEPCGCACVFATTGPADAQPNYVNAIKLLQELRETTDPDEVARQKESWAALEADLRGATTTSDAGELRCRQCCGHSPFCPTQDAGAGRQWITCAKCGRQRDASTLDSKGSFVCRSCFSTEALLDPVATPVADELRAAIGHVTQGPIEQGGGQGQALRDHEQRIHELEMKR